MKNDNFDKAKLIKTSDYSMHKLSKTKPIEFFEVNPLNALENLCSEYNFSPEDRKKEIMTVLATSAQQPLQTHVTNDDMERVIQTISRQEADFAFQVCMNAYRDKNGMNKIEVNLKNIESYEYDNWTE
ncbi:hypothetical protein [Budvicia diplopodorum]|uniref:hypothetical protein n=1 Tax=Budvicia diplopodorum TaxID=1119056 RepID=UPI0013579BD6|nr:hypothetical protein [Budvicia diplopodorum]